MPDPEPIKSTSPDTFLRQHNAEGADASTERTGNLPLKSSGDMDTLYQRTETTVTPKETKDPRNLED